MKYVLPRFHLVILLLLPVLSSAQTIELEWQLEIVDEAVLDLVDPQASLEVLATGFEWSEGPTWVPDKDSGYILFSDVPMNRMYKWSEIEGISTFLDPAGFEGGNPAHLREPGTNGLITLNSTHIVAANHGTRGLTLISLASREKTPLAEHFDGLAFNSPNDLVSASNGDIYFTDPPFGLTGMDRSPVRETPFSGVYLRRENGDVVLIDGSLDFPNGITLLPGERQLIVSNAQATRPVWKRYTLDDRGQVIDFHIMHDASQHVMEGDSGLPDGMTVDTRGNIFATGPGGIYIFSVEGKLMGRIKLDSAAANCTFGGINNNELYITADDKLLRLPVLTSGLMLH